MFKRVLIVCVGNICRSPTAEYLLRDRLGASSDVRVSSAGLGALVGRPMDATALDLLREHGVDGAAHQARQLTPALLREADLVIVMEKTHAASVGRMAPEASGKVFLLDKWLNGADIPDPFRQQRPAFEHVYKLIDSGVAHWVRFI